MHPNRGCQDKLEFSLGLDTSTVQLRSAEGRSRFGGGFGVSKDA